jgi:L-alanine-DL-glutamate epimerase-like enolase superfamily enzyme
MQRRNFLKASGTAAAAVWTGAWAAAADATGDLPNDLASHRIAKIETQRSVDRYARSLGPNSKRGPHGRGYARPFRTVTTDQGAVGFGMCWGPEERIAPFVGAKVGDLFDPAVGTDDEAGLLDYVLHDLAGVILRKPVYEMMGAKGPTAIDIYSGAIYMDDLMPTDNPAGIEAVLAACQMDYDAGYRAFKLKIGRGRKWMPRAEGDRRDIEVTRAVRERFPDCRILVDANDGYSVDGFLKYVTAVADCELFWIEEPFDEHREGLMQLKEHMAKVGCKAYIADGEARQGSAPHLWRWGEYTREFIDRFFALAEDDLIDVCVFDIGTLGYTRWRRAMPTFERAGILAAPHLWGCTPKPLYCAHLAAGVGNVLIVEGIPGVGQHLDYSQFKIVNGKIHVPETPGFGIIHKPGPGVGPAKG